MRDAADHVDLDPAEERRGLLTDGDHVDLGTLVLPRAHFAQHLAEQVVVQTAGQAAVGRDHDVADPLDLLTLHQERMLVVGAGLRQMPDHLLHGLRVGTRGLHAFLRLADLGGRDHFERARHLAGVLHALDLGFDFASACHTRSLRSWDSGLVIRDWLKPPASRTTTPEYLNLEIRKWCFEWPKPPNNRSYESRLPNPKSRLLTYQLPVVLNSSMPFLNAASMSLSQPPVVLILETSSPWVLAKCACRPSSNASSLLTGTSSR